MIVSYLPIGKTWTLLICIIQLRPTCFWYSLTICQCGLNLARYEVSAMEMNIYQTEMGDHPGNMVVEPTKMCC
jgi:hypothetical protein